LRNSFFESSFAKSSKFIWDFHSKIEYLEEWENLANLYDKFLISKKFDERKSYPQLIPKKIHQIWIGSKKLPKKYKIWMKTWRKHNPSWEYILWDDEMIDNLDLINKDAYYSTSNPGYKSDIARYEILNKFGGLYVDTDFECLKEFPDYFLTYEFVNTVGFSYHPSVMNGFIFSKPNSTILEKVINSVYIPENFKDPMNIFNSSGPYIFSKVFFSLTHQERTNTLMLPTDFFYPLPSFALSSKAYRKQDFLTNESLAIHHWEVSWTKSNLFKRIIKKILQIMRSFFEK
tara:strand:- start:672 stop:1535 length:864 start_codon:yes stop_codon:yes gene_type:complete